MSHLHLSIFPMNLPDAQINVGVFPYESHDVLRELRAKHAGTHIFKKVTVEEAAGWKEYIYGIALDGNPCGIAPEQAQIALWQNLGVARALVEERFISGFAGKADRKIVDVDPIKVLSAEKEHDFIGQAAQPASVPAWLIVRLAHIIEVRVFEFDGQDPFLGLIFDHRGYRRIERLCSEWIADGLDLTGLYVSERVAYRDPRIPPRLRLVGRVAKVEGDTLQLTDCREGRQLVAASEVEIEADYDGFMRCLNKLFPGRARTIERRIFDLQSAAQMGPKKLSELTRIENILTLRAFPLLPGCEATVLAHLDERQGRFPKARQAPQALYVFDPTFNKPALTDHKIGIAENGPYSQRGFTPSKPRICVVCERARKG